ncbi:MAG: 2OG-Fe(II) oxygenase family protein [Gammaproteobacteria bacterium]
MNCLRSDIERVGFGYLDNPLADGQVASLRREAAAQRAGARRACDDGAVSYRGYLAELGAIAIGTLTGPPVGGLLDALFGRHLVLARNSSCYTYYEAGDFLSAHRDDGDDCEVTVLIYLEAVSPDPEAAGSGLQLRIHVDQGGSPGAISQSIGTRANRLVVGRGAQIWHGRPTLNEGERVSLLSACFSQMRD